ncbi:ParM/StbA family protein [Virgibacillus sp. AGTR]|uniref:ParM/StbA family protein n=1 Tax=Virgibacillus sp. AGTR TaxID=2812055 RepID=UPI001D16ADB9|nr:ParM/StbA family protein [Virgibacillus sp. AGTR]MCC2252725.1 ParM/StbA family protein [Virgibacillus sp. AGTR]
MAGQPIVAGLDLGNGYVKANINGLVRVFPSIAVKQFNTAHHTPIAEDEVGTFMKDIINQMDVSFSSPLVRSTERRLFGERALKSGLNLEEFDVFARIGKSEVDLSGVLALATIAADRLQDYYEKNEKLPASKLKVKADMATALPIGEYKRHAKAYLQKYVNDGAPHIVTFHNFERPVHVEIMFEHAYVANEGESAQYGLMLAKDAFLEMIRREAVKRFPNGELDGITGKDLVSAKNTLGIDIGEGTIDFAVFSNGRFNADASSTMIQGYGSVLESTLSKLQEEGYPYKSRKELSEFLHNEPSPFTKRKWTHVKEVNQSEENRFGDVVSGETSKVFSRVGGFIEVIFVFGGGATPLEWSLFEKLQSRVAEFGDDNLLPIVYLDSDFSRFLNVQGLYQVAQRLRQTASGSKKQTVKAK